MGKLKEIKELTDRALRTGSARNAVEEEGTDDLKAMFEKSTPEEKAHGKLVGKIIQAHGNVDVEGAWAWFEQEHNKGVQLTYIQKILTLMHATGLLDASQTQYNAIRKMFLTVNNRT